MLDESALRRISEELGVTNVSYHFSVPGRIEVPYNFHRASSEDAQQRSSDGDPESAQLCI
jgi:hypothetical protein